MADDQIISTGDPAVYRPEKPALLGADGRPMAAPAEDPPKIDRASRRTIVTMIVVAIVGVLLILWAWRLWPFTGSVVTTENSYVRGQITVLAPQVNGYVAEVLVQDYQRVKAGQPLVRIDDRIYRQQLDQAQGQLANSEANLSNSAQTSEQNDAEIEARRADLYAAEAERERARVDEARVNELAQRGSVSLRERDQIRATARAAAANVYKAQAAIRIAEQGAKATTVSRGGLTAQVQTARAQVKLAQINLANTIIRAPRDGQLSEASVRLGQYVSAGSQLLFLVPDAIWVVANFKETQVRGIRPGQRATFAVDALGDERLHGHVQGFAPATGSEFSVLRPDNASGNFTKVVQRLPVRITIDPGQTLARRLRPGMSVVTRVDTASPGTDDRP
jgi:multidrug resistance efflux pump